MDTSYAAAGWNRLCSSADWLADDRGAAFIKETHSESDPLLSFFIPDLTVGGAEQVVVNIVNGLADRGYPAELVLSERKGELLSQVASGISIVELPPKPAQPLGVATHLPALTVYLSRKEPTVLFTHLTQASVVALSAKRLLDVETAVIPTHHAASGVSTDRSIKRTAVRQLTRRLYPSADRIIAVSKCVGDTVAADLSVDPRRISVLHNPVEVASIQKQAATPVDHKWIEDDDTDVVLFVGRIADQKDLRTWLRAFKTVHAQHPDLRGVIVGQGPRRNDIIEYAAELGLDDIVSVPGYVDNPFRYMAQASVFLLSSHSEGLPTVLIEALACGCPIVSTECPCGPREILGDGRYGGLAPVGDVDRLAESVVAQLDDPVPSETLRRRAMDFSPDSILDDYEAFLQQYVTVG
jgi:glycosyltransferase involved in cell wall biosynthesis